jgi:hypothetical protein
LGALFASLICCWGFLSLGYYYYEVKPALRCLFIFWFLVFWTADDNAALTRVVNPSRDIFSCFCAVVYFSSDLSEKRYPFRLRFRPRITRTLRSYFWAELIGSRLGSRKRSVCFRKAVCVKRIHEHRQLETDAVTTQLSVAWKSHTSREPKQFASGQRKRRTQWTRTTG